MDLPAIWDVVQGVFMVGTIIGGFYLATRKAPMERTSLDAGAANQYAQAAKQKAEENAQLIMHVSQLETRLEAIENKRYKISIEFVTGEPPEVVKAEVAQILLPTKK